MPKRPTEKTQDSTLNYSAIDIAFLPENLIKKITDIYDNYFSLGVRKNIINKPEDVDIFPNKFSTLNSIQLGDLLSDVTAWQSFIGDKLKYMTVASSIVEQELDNAYNSEMASFVMGKGNIEEKKSIARGSESYMIILNYKQKLSGVKLMLEHEIGIYEKRSASVSREISRREANAGF